MRSLSTKQVLAILSSEKQALHEQFGVTSIGLFGSFAKESQSEKSDIDLFVEFEQPRFDRLAGLQIYLEKKLGKKIEIIRKGSHLSDRFRNLIEKDIIYV